MSLLSAKGLVQSHRVKRAFSTADENAAIEFASGDLASMISGVPLLGPMFSAAQAPEGRGTSRFFHTLGGGTLGGIGGGLIGGRLGLTPQQIRYLGNTGGLGGGAYGAVLSSREDTLGDRIGLALDRTF